MTTRYDFRRVADVDVFYREAGPRDAQAILLLHGFPTASHMFRDLIPLLADRYRLIAPEMPGFGQTKAPPRGTFDYSFGRLADVIEGFTEAMSLGSICALHFRLRCARGSSGPSGDAYRDSSDGHRVVRCRQLLDMHNVRRSADGRLRGVFWIVHVSLSAGAHGPVCVLEPQKSKAS